MDSTTLGGSEYEPLPLEIRLESRLLFEGFRRGDQKKKKRKPPRNDLLHPSLFRFIYKIQIRRVQRQVVFVSRLEIIDDEVFVLLIFQDGLNFRSNYVLCFMEILNDFLYLR